MDYPDRAQGFSERRLLYRFVSSDMLYRISRAGPEAQKRTPPIYWLPKQNLKDG